MKNKLDIETTELIEKYFDAFSNLYGIISMKRALRIIKEQNPNIGISEGAFMEFVRTYNFDKKYYIIVYDSEMYSNELSNETDILSKFLITEFLYSVDDEAYDEMKAIQEGIRFYVPAKEELLKYADQFYIGKNDFHTRMKEFLCNELHINIDLADDIIDEWLGIWIASTNDDMDIEYLINRMRLMTRNKFCDFRNVNQAQKFTKLFVDMYNNTRLPIYRGHTPKEVNRRADCEVNENLQYDFGLTK